MDKRFYRMFDMTEDEAIALLDKPIEDMAEDDVRYIAAAHLVNYPTDRSIDALIRAVENTHPSLDNRITRRKAVETLGRLEVERSLPHIRKCLAEADRFTVENAVSAIGEIGTEDPEILAEMAALLDVEDKISRTVIRTLSKLGYKLATDKIRRYADSTEEPLYSAAISALYSLNSETDQLDRWLALFQSSNVNSRRCSIQDAIDANYLAGIPQIARCPVSQVFRLRALRILGCNGLASGELNFADIQPALDAVVRDRPDDLDLVHAYDQPPSLDFLIRDLFNTDFGRCYLATKTIVEQNSEDSPVALLETYKGEASSDYGANYHVLKTFGWLKYRPAYDLFIEALHQTIPQYQKSRTAAAIALGELGDCAAITELRSALQSNVWGLKYAALLALEQLGDRTSAAELSDDSDPLIRSRAQQVMSA